MGLALVHGFRIAEQSMSAAWGVQTIREVVLVEMESADETTIDVRNALPAFGTVGAVITFTIGRSAHPDDPSAILKEAPSVKPEPVGGQPFWLVEMVYETANWLNYQFMSPREDQGKGNLGSKKRYIAGVAIKYPWDEPPTWSGGTKSVRLSTHKSSTGAALRHANGLPIAEGIDIELILETHTFTWNVQYDSFTWSTQYAPYIGKVNSSAVFSQVKWHVLCDSITAVENIRTVKIPVSNAEDDTGATEEHHFITINASFIFDIRATGDGYFRDSNKRISQHTLQYLPTLKYGPIPVNTRGDIATSPWPFPSDAAATALGIDTFEAFPFAALPAANPATDFFLIDPVLPEEANLTAFVAAHNLVIP